MLLISVARAMVKLSKKSMMKYIRFKLKAAIYKYW